MLEILNDAKMTAEADNAGDSQWLQGDWLPFTYR